MFAEIITIGDEILIGQVVDTNSAFIAKQLNKIGVSIYQVTSVQDDGEHILKSLGDASKRVQLVVLTGGLGPTKDDVTKHAFCQFFGDHLVNDEAVLAHVEALFTTYDVPIYEENRQQALVPSRAQVLHNPFGSAPGLWMEHQGTVFVSLPGVPYEMENLIRNEVIPRVEKHFDRPYIQHRTLVTYGMGESAIAKRIEEWENALPPFIRLAYLPSLGRVRLRLTAKGSDKMALQTSLDRQLSHLKELIPELVYGADDGETLEGAVGRSLAQKKMTLATAESFTGGAIAQRITAIPGASTYFVGGVVPYATEAKVGVLGVSGKIVEQHSVVSSQVVEAMALHAQKLFKAHFAISTTGNAGPTKGDSSAEVGTVFIGIASPTGVSSHTFNFGKNRHRVVEKSIHKGLELLWKEIEKF
ncbi:MAG: competence/damage-inducible protein A [Flavobacteriaceae bacterium]